MAEFSRSSGILLHPTSFPGPHGIGTFNKAAYEFVDFLARAGQKLWQVLPMGPTSYGDSPYQSFSSFAGNPYLVALETLVEEGLLDAAALDGHPAFVPRGVDYCQMYEWKLPLLLKAAGDFEQRANPAQKADFHHFCSAHGPDWLDDFALFMALKHVQGGKAWNEWPVELRDRHPEALARARHQQAELVHGHRFIQWLFERNWQHLRRYANGKGIRVIGDIPIFVAMDSADTWVAPHAFHLDKNKRPSVQAGVPPDYFSPDGQLWGNPLYRWKEMKQDGFLWWLARIQAAFRLYDIVRVDHFRGFAAYYEVSGKAKNARQGRWVKAPGLELFRRVKKVLGDLPIIAEDLGLITPDVLKLVEATGFPGMKVLQFAFGSDANDKFLPHNYTSHCVAYTGTHDNDTSQGWYETADESHKDYFRRYFNTDGLRVAHTLIRGVFASVASMVVVPLQDLLEVGTEGRMNFPGRRHDNWLWRYDEGAIKPEHEQFLLDLARTYGRA